MQDLLIYHLHEKKKIVKKSGSTETNEMVTRYGLLKHYVRISYDGRKKKRKELSILGYK